jgi:hypothetical protein
LTRELNFAHTEKKEVATILVYNPHPPAYMSFPDPTAKRDEEIEIIGTIVVIEPVTFEQNHCLQRIVIGNARTVNNTVGIPSTVLLVARVSAEHQCIPFQLNDPVTVKGTFKRLSRDFLSYIYNAHAPLGYIRYNGKIYH